MTTYLRAEFADAGSITGYLPEYGTASWGGSPADWVRSGGYVTPNGDLFYTGTSTQNPTLTVVAKTDDIGTSLNIILNRIDENNYWIASISFEESLIYLTEVVASTPRFSKAFPAGSTLVAGQDYVFKFIIDDDTIFCFVDDVQAFIEKIPGRTSKTSVVHGLDGNDSNVKVGRLIIQG